MTTSAPKATKGDLGKQRQEYAKRLGTFKQTKTTGSDFGSRVTPNQTRESDYSKSGSVRVMENYPQTDVSGVRGTGYATVRSKNPGGSKRPAQASPFKTYPMTGAPQGNESPARGESSNV